MQNDDAPQAPEWFRWAVAQPGTVRSVEVDGARLNLLTWHWDDSARPALLLVHGLMGHARWWDFIAPFLADRFRIAAMDLSGMGESEGRTQYSGERFARDIIGTIDQLGLAPATVIGHSYGGSRTLLASVLSPHSIGHAIALDSYYHVPGTQPPLGMPPADKPRLYADYASARARYRLAPEQPVALPYVVDYLARHSAREVAGGWTWKFDHRLTIIEEENGVGLLKGVGARVDFVAGERSALVTPEVARCVAAALPRGRSPIIIPEAHHHMMVDQPLALIGVLRALLA